jgi:prevent-host-death family protein
MDEMEARPQLTKLLTKSNLNEGDEVMTTVNVHEAKTHLSRLLERVEAGEEIIVARAGKPVAKLVPFEESRPKRVPGTGRGEIEIADDFDDDLPDDILDMFDGKSR